MAPIPLNSRHSPAPAANRARHVANANPALAAPIASAPGVPGPSTTREVDRVGCFGLGRFCVPFTPFVHGLRRPWIETPAVTPAVPIMPPHVRRLTDLPPEGVVPFLGGNEAAALAAEFKAWAADPDVQRARLFHTYAIVTPVGTRPERLTRLLGAARSLELETAAQLQWLGGQARGLQEESGLETLKAGHQIRNKHLGQRLTAAGVLASYVSTWAGSTLLNRPLWAMLHFGVGPIPNEVSRMAFAAHLRNHLLDVDARHPGAPGIPTEEQIDHVVAVAWATLRQINAIRKWNDADPEDDVRWFAGDGGPMFVHELDALQAVVGHDLRAPVAAYLRAHRADYCPHPAGYDGAQIERRIPALSVAAIAEYRRSFDAPGDVRARCSLNEQHDGSYIVTHLETDKEVLREASERLFAAYEKCQGEIHTPEEIATLCHGLLWLQPFGTGTDPFVRHTLLPQLLAENGLPIAYPALQAWYSGTANALADALHANADRDHRNVVILAGPFT